MPASMWADIRYAARALARNPVYSLAVVATLALGIGATTSLFSVVHAAILRQLPYPDANRLLSVSTTARGGDDRGVAHQPWVLEWERSARSFAGVAAYMPSAATLTGRGEPVAVRGMGVTKDFFTTIGMRPVRGRIFDATDFANAAAARPVILGHALWRDAFGADVNAVGTTMLLDGRARTIVGVMPEEFTGPYAAQYLEPGTMSPALVSAGSYSVRYAFVLARLRADVTIDAARAELASLARRAEDAVPAAFRDTSSAIVAMTAHERLYGAAKRPLFVLGCAVAFLLLVACANVANLSLARAVARQQEFSVRTALGASRWRLARIALTESVLLAIAGAGLGMAIPFWTLPLVLQFKPASLANVSALNVNGEVLAFAMLVAIAVGLAFGAVPALASARHSALGALHARGGRVSGTRWHARVRHTLIVAEIATAVAMVTGAGVLARSLANVLAIDPGFRGDHIMTASIALPRARYANVAARTAFFAEVSERVAALPGVEAVAYSAGTAPLGVHRPNYEYQTEDGQRVNYAVASVNHRYPVAAGLILKRGRLFEPGDEASAELPLLISESVAKSAFRDADPIGQKMSAMFEPRLEPGSGGPVPPKGTVVGVVQDVAQGNFEGETVGLLYRLINQADWAPSLLLIRASDDPAPLMAAVRGVVHAVDPLQPVGTFRTLKRELQMATGTRRFGAALVGAFAAIAMALAAAGLYGVMSYQVAQRTREIGIRLALGAPAARIRALLLGEGMAVAGVGIVAGVALAFAVTRLLRGFVFGVSATDPLTLVAAPLILALVAALACLVPARRASRVSPLEALRGD